MSARPDARALVSELLGEDSAFALERFAAIAAMAPHQTPPNALRARLLAAAAQPRYAWLDRMARLLHIAEDRARALLDGLDNAALWATTPTPGVLFQHLHPGPATAGAVVGFVKVPAGTAFPHHVHIGQEHVLVLEGGFRDMTGKVFLPGDISPMPPGSEHHFDALPGDDLLYLAVIFEGVEFGPEAGGLILP